MQAEPTRILAIRHGETAWNLAARMQGHLDIPLNETGRRQAALMAQALAGEELHALYASDLQRAIETAQALAAVSGLPVMTDAGLRERSFGVFEGLTFDEIEQRWPDAAQSWRSRRQGFAPDGGESLEAFYERSVGTATRLAQAHAGETIAMVAHGGVLDCLYRAASRLDLSAPRSWLVENTSINRLLYTPQGFTLVGWGDTLHLDGQALDEEADGARAA